MISDLQGYCHSQRAFYIVDPASGDTFTSVQGTLSGITGVNAINSALYFPWVNAPDPLQQGRLNSFPPCGFVAGIYAATDASRGVWKAPAGIDASLTGEAGPNVLLTDLENGTLNVQAINCMQALSGLWRCRLGRSDPAGQRSGGFRVEICSDSAARIVSRIQSL